MRQLTKTQQAVMFFGLFFIAVYFCVPSDNCLNCIARERFRQEEFEGVVIKKYLDRSDHSTPIAELRNTRDSIEKIYLFGSGLFDGINTGDSLKKSKGTIEVLIKINSKYHVCLTDFNCDSVKLKEEEYLFGLYDLIGTIPDRGNRTQN
jgi:hypothetical protein